MSHISQADFDTVLFGIRSQGGPSVRGAACSYRGFGGLKCAAGWLIADGAYQAEWEGSVAEGIPAFRGREDLWDIAALQSIHDGAAIEHGENDTIERFTAEEFFPVWEPLMEAFAVERGLTYTLPVTP